MKMPKLGDTADEVLVLGWLRGIGERVEVNDEVLRVETSKAETVVESPFAGTLVEYLVKIDDEIAVGDLIFVIESD